MYSHNLMKMALLFIGKVVHSYFEGGINNLSNVILKNIPGLILCLIVTLLGIYIADLIGLLLVNMNVLPTGSASPVSGIFVAIIFGIIIRNIFGLHEIFGKGVTFALKYALRDRKSVV